MLHREQGHPVGHRGNCTEGSEQGHGRASEQKCGGNRDLKGGRGLGCGDKIVGSRRESRDARHSHSGQGAVVLQQGQRILAGDMVTALLGMHHEK